MKNVALYVRVSTQEQKLHGYSIDAQLDALKEYCAKNNLNIIDIYNDAGLSASKKLKNRTELSRLCSDCEKGLIDTILFTKLDRWFRNIADYYQVQAILDKNNVVWRAIWEDYETETSSGRFKVNIMLSIAEAESARTSERIKSIYEYSKDNGRYFCKLPMGYTRIDREIVKDENTKHIIELAFESYLTALSVKPVQNKLRDEGIILERKRLYRILKNPIYCGEVNGLHFEPYISKEDFEKIQASFDTRIRSTKKNTINPYIFRGCGTCAICGSPLVMRTTKSPKGIYYKNVHCLARKEGSVNHELVTISVDELENYILNELDKVVTKHNEDIKLTNEQIDNSKKLEALEKKLLRIGDRYEDGNISREEYKTKTEAIKREINIIKSTQQINEPITIPDKWQDMYNLLDASHKLAFWRSIGFKFSLNTDKNIKLYF